MANKDLQYLCSLSLSLSLSNTKIAYYNVIYEGCKTFIICSIIKGYIVRPSLNGEGSELGYVSHTDPHGKLPVWLVNKITQIFAPKVREPSYIGFLWIIYKLMNFNYLLSSVLPKKMVKKLHKASIGYPTWKMLNNPNFKPWHFPEQIMSPRIKTEDVC